MKPLIIISVVLVALLPGSMALRRTTSLATKLDEAVTSVQRIIDIEENLMRLSWIWNDGNGKPHTVEAKLAWNPDLTASQNKTAFQAVVEALKDLYPPN